jgi:hypothetical protein
MQLMQSTFAGLLIACAMVRRAALRADHNIILRRKNLLTGNAWDSRVLFQDFTPLDRSEKFGYRASGEDGFSLKIRSRHPLWLL